MPPQIPLEEPGQTFLVDPYSGETKTRPETQHRRLGAAAMTNDLVCNTPLTDHDIARRLGVSDDTITLYRLAASAPIADRYEDLWQFWNYHMAHAKRQGLRITHSRKE